MGGFNADWLALREPADARARATGLTAAVAARLAGASIIRVLDLAAGTGANVRYLAASLRADQAARHWLLVDHDASLLNKVSVNLATGDRLETRVVDLAAAFEPAAANLCENRDLVTASALLDLVSEHWLRALARRCRDARATVLFALSYDGRIHCHPEDSEDEATRAFVNDHQRTDKGFGPALGPAGSEAAAQAFAALGYQVHRERSDWTLDEDARGLQTQLIEGWAEAAVAVAPDRADRLRDWKARRLAHVTAGQSRIVVGHDDLAAWLE